MNVALTKCYLCSEDNEILMSTRINSGNKFIEKAHGKVVSKDRHCNKCNEYKKQGIIIISVKDDDQEYRTGGWWVMKAESVERIFKELKVNQELLSDVLRKRVCFLADQVCDIIGLVKGETN